MPSARSNQVPLPVRPAESPAAVPPIHSLLEGLEQARSICATNDRPFVTLAYAQSIDGSIARRRGERFPLSGPDSLRLTHHLRGRHDAILVGVGTILADDPQLSVRLAEGTDPQPIVVDSSLRTRPDARLLQRPGRPLWIGTTGREVDPWKWNNNGGDAVPRRGHGDQKRGQLQIDRQRRAAALESRGAQLLAAPTLPNGWVDLAALLRTLKTRGINRLMVEGGAQIITSFLRERLVDYAVVTVAPLFLGGLAAVSPGADHGDDPRGAPSTASTAGQTVVPRFRTWNSHRLGDDLVVAGDLHWPAS